MRGFAILKNTLGVCIPTAPAYGTHMVRVPRARADVLLVSRGLCSSRERARALILAGQVFSGDRRVDKAGESLAQDAPLDVRGQDMPFVSRGGVKLQGALSAFGLSPEGVVVADFGASTGGFTDCLLQAGARRVYAIDVGYGQLHLRLRNDPRVVVMERTNARHLQAADIPETVDWVVIDASFIGLEKLLPAAQHILRPGGQIVALVKPQFQVGRQVAQRTAGVVRDPVLRANAIDQVGRAAAELGFNERGRADASIRGPKGNLEAFLWLQKPEGHDRSHPRPGPEPRANFHPAASCGGAYPVASCGEGDSAVCCGGPGIARAAEMAREGGFEPP